jgi:hypothetical protein
VRALVRNGVEPVEARTLTAFQASGKLDVIFEKFKRRAM